MSANSKRRERSLARNRLRYVKRKAKAVNKADFRKALAEPSKDIRLGMELWQPLQSAPLSQINEQRLGKFMSPFPVKEMGLWRNDQWQVLVSEGKPDKNGIVMLHLLAYPAGEHRDHWAVLQQIKNEVLGEEQEMCQLYPAESRMVNAQPMYHLWGVKGVALSFGWLDGDTQTVALPVSSEAQTGCQGKGEPTSGSTADGTERPDAVGQLENISIFKIVR